MSCESVHALCQDAALMALMALGALPWHGQCRFPRGSSGPWESVGDIETKVSHMKGNSLRDPQLPSPSSEESPLPSLPSDNSFLAPPPVATLPWMVPRPTQCPRVAVFHFAS